MFPSAARLGICASTTKRLRSSIWARWMRTNTPSPSSAASGTASNRMSRLAMVIITRGAHAPLRVLTGALAGQDETLQRDETDRRADALQCSARARNTAREGACAPSMRKLAHSCSSWSRAHVLPQIHEHLLEAMDADDADAWELEINDDVNRQ